MKGKHGTKRGKSGVCKRKTRKSLRYYKHGGSVSFYYPHIAHPRLDPRLNDMEKKITKIFTHLDDIQDIQEKTHENIRRIVQMTRNRFNGIDQKIDDKSKNDMNDLQQQLTNYVDQKLDKSKNDMNDIQQQLTKLDEDFTNIVDNMNEVVNGVVNEVRTNNENTMKKETKYLQTLYAQKFHHETKKLKDRIIELEKEIEKLKKPQSMLKTKMTEKMSDIN
jgi:exonuclease VII large subunit